MPSQVPLNELENQTRFSKSTWIRKRESYSVLAWWNPNQGSPVSLKNDLKQGFFEGGSESLGEGSFCFGKVEPQASFSRVNEPEFF